MAAALASNFEALVDLFPICFQSPARSGSAHARPRLAPTAALTTNHAGSQIYPPASADRPNTTHPCTRLCSLLFTACCAACARRLYLTLPARTHSLATANASALRKYKSDSSPPRPRPPPAPRGDSSPPPPGTSRECEVVSASARLYLFARPSFPFVRIWQSPNTKPHLHLGPAVATRPALTPVHFRSSSATCAPAIYPVACVSPTTPCSYIRRSAPRSSPIPARTNIEPSDDILSTTFMALWQ